MNSLSPREKQIMALRYLSGKTQVEVAKEIGISQAQVSRLEKNALARIKREPVSYTHLDVYKRQIVTYSEFNFHSGKV